MQLDKATVLRDLRGQLRRISRLVINDKKEFKFAQEDKASLLRKTLPANTRRSVASQFFEGLGGLGLKTPEFEMAQNTTPTWEGKPVGYKESCDKVLIFKINNKKVFVFRFRHYFSICFWRQQCFVFYFRLVPAEAKEIEKTESPKYSCQENNIRKSKKIMCIL